MSLSSGASTGFGAAPIAGTCCNKEKVVLNYAVIFLVIAIIAGVLGFGGIAGTAAGIAKILFVAFLILAVLSLIFGRKK